MTQEFIKNLNKNYDLEQKFYNELVIKSEIEYLSQYTEKINLTNLNIDQRQKILLKLDENKLYEFSLSLYASTEFLCLKFEEQKYYLNILYRFGQIKDFFEKCSVLGEALLVNKVYCRLEEYLEEFKSRLGNRFNFKLLSLIFNLESKNIIVVEKIIKNELKIYYQNKVNIREIEKIYIILEEYFFDCYRLNHLKLKLKHLLAYAQRYEVLPKEIMDFTLQAENYSELLLVGSILKSDKLNLMKNILVERKPKELENIFYKKMYSEIFSMKLLKVESFEKILPKENDVITKEEKISKVTVVDTVSSEYKSYKTSLEEQEMISSLRVNNELVITKDLILSFLFSEQYSVADYLLQLYVDDDMNYEKAFVKYKMQNYSECIYLINTYLSLNSNADSLEALFYLKGLSFEEQGNRDGALNSFREVNKRNPNFKQIRKKILSYEKN